MSDNSNPSHSNNPNPSNSASGSNPSDPSRSTTSTSTPLNTNTNTNTNISNTESLTARIQSSASNLARSALTSTPSDITAVGSGAEKGSARPPAGQTYYTQSTGPSSSSASGLGASSSGPGSGVSFRTEQRQGQSEATPDGQPFEAYNFDPVDPSIPVHGEGSELGQWASPGSKGKGKEAETDTFERVWSTQQQYRGQGQGQGQGQGVTYTQVPTDGSDVLTLLSSPTFNPDFPDTNANANANAEGETNQIIPDLSDYTPESTGLSPSELQTLESFRRSQGQGQPPPQPQTRITSTSLIPDIDTFLSTMPAQSTATEETQLRDAVLTGLSGSEDWVSVEERYHDEVWGFLKPVLQAAQKEIEAKEENHPGEGDHTEDGPAVARLKMILRHMRE